MKFVLLTIMLMSTACATLTSYEKCQKSDEWQRYGSMDTCVSNKEDERIREEENWRRAGQASATALQHMGASISRPAPRPTQTNCFTNYYGGTAMTNCSSY